MARAGLVALIALAVVGAPGADARTRVVRYTPFTADGDVKSCAASGATPASTTR